ncbi:IS110 family transposase [Candidatus Woesearchaeota archaeon]|nr:IS110 family transposase [Candidatus Woesearchaeota archaeon]
MKTRISLAPDSYKGQVISVGIDVHKKNWKVSLVMNGIILKTYSCNPDVEQLVKSLANTYPMCTFKFCYEAGFCGFWISRKLKDLGFECIVVNPADVPKTQKEEFSKNDTVDSRKLARELERKSLRGIYIPEVDEESFRDLCRIRTSLVRDQTMMKNRIKSFMNKYNVKSSELDSQSKWSKKYLSLLKNLRFDSPASTIAFSFYLKQLDEISSNLKDVESEIKRILKIDQIRKEVYDHLVTIPGVAFVCSIVLISELINMQRFKNDNELLSYIGLIPSTKSSGDKEFSRGITFRHKKRLRNTLIESAWTAIKSDPALLLAYNKLLTRMSGTKAIVRIAKKLVKRIRYVWNNMKDYQFGIIE